MTSMHFVKQNAVNEVTNYNRTDYYDKGSNLPATGQTIDVRRHLGKLPLPRRRRW